MVMGMEKGKTMTNNEAIEWLKHIRDKYIHGGDQWFDEQRCRAIEYAIECIYKSNTWIPVSERLPENELPKCSNVKQLKVLTALISDKGVRTVRSQMRYKDTWATGHDRWRWKYSGSEITHWMPLPEPPKEE